MATEMLILRLLHIFTGVFWAGGIFYLAFFIFPAVKSLGPDGGKFMQQLTHTRQMPNLMSLAGLTNVLAGFRIMQLHSGNFQSAWFESSFGMAITIGATFALIALIIGIGYNRPRAGKMAQIGQVVAASGAPASADQMQVLGKLRSQLEMGVKTMAWLLLLTVLLMATARYI